MASSVFEKILKIVQILVAVLQMAVKSFTNFREEEEDEPSSD